MYRATELQDNDTFCDTNMSQPKAFTNQIIKTPFCNSGCRKCEKFEVSWLAGLSALSRAAMLHAGGGACIK